MRDDNEKRLLASLEKIKVGEGITVATLSNGDGKIASATKAEDGYVWLTVADEQNQRVVQIALAGEDARTLGMFLIDATDRSK